MTKTNPIFDLDEQDSDQLIGLEENRLGRYVLKRLLGRGGMGAVYEAISDDNKRVALKLLDPKLSRNPEFKSVFLHEIVHLSRSRHDGLVKFVDSFFSTLGTLALVMEYVDGVTLRCRLHERPGRRLPLEQVALIGIQIAGAIGSLHEQGIVHGDLKPENLMLVPGADPDDPEHAKVIDFGIARTINQTGLSGAHDHDFGSPPYQAPEQLTSRLFTRASDVYALGILLHEAAAGHPPLVGTLDPFSLSQELPQPFLGLLRRMIASNPAERPSMKEVERILDEIACSLIPSRITPLHWEKSSAPRQEMAVGVSARGEKQNSGKPRTRTASHLLRAVSAVLLVGTLAASTGMILDARKRSAAQPQAPYRMSYVPASVVSVGSTPGEVETAYGQCIKEACEIKKECDAPNRLCGRDAFERELTQHRVLIPHDFFVDNELVTKGEWVHYMNNMDPRKRVEEDRDTHKPRYIYLDNNLIYDLHEMRNDIQLVDGRYAVKSGREDQPVEQVSWIGAYNYCRFKGKQLLTEAHWEYLKTRATSSGSERLNMSPGLSEWVADGHRSQYAPCQEPCPVPSPEKDTMDPTGYRVVRGCSSADLPVYCRSSSRGYQKANAAPRDVGFRCMTPIEAHASVAQKPAFGCSIR